MSSTDALSSKFVNPKQLINIVPLLQDLTCSICTQYFNDPRTLNCGHTFCVSCIKKSNSVCKKGSESEKLYRCKNCSEYVYLENIEKLPKNSLLNSLISLLNEKSKTNKAACPSCNKVDELTVCDHCSHIFCPDCLKKHFGIIFGLMDARLTDLEALPKKLEDFQGTLDLTEQKIFENLMEKMTEIQNQILVHCSRKKAQLLDDIKHVFKLKRDHIELAKFRFKVLDKDLVKIKSKKDSLEKELILQNSHAKNQETYNKSLRELSILEDKVKGLQKSYDDVGYKKLETEVKVKCELGDNLKVFQCFLDSIRVAIESEEEEENPKENDKEEMFHFEDYMGNKAAVKLKPKSLITIERLKNEAKNLLGVEPRYINLIDKKTNAPLDDDLQLWFEDGNMYQMRTDVNGNNQEDSKNEQINLIISYSYNLF